VLPRLKSGHISLLSLSSSLLSVYFRLFATELQLIDIIIVQQIMLCAV